MVVCVCVGGRPGGGGGGAGGDACRTANPQRPRWRGYACCPGGAIDGPPRAQGFCDGSDCQKFMVVPGEFGSRMTDPRDILVPPPPPLPPRSPSLAPCAALSPLITRQMYIVPDAFCCQSYSAAFPGPRRRQSRRRCIPRDSVTPAFASSLSSVRLCGPQFLNDLASYWNTPGPDSDNLHAAVTDWFWWCWNANSADTGGMARSPPPPHPHPPQNLINTSSSAAPGNPCTVQAVTAASAGRSAPCFD